MAKFWKRAFRRLGYNLEPLNAGYPVDFAPEDISTINFVRPYTMTSPERVFSLVQAVKYIVAAKIEGSFIECGVWKGGSMMAVAKTLAELKTIDRDLFLFDTFEGMSAPSEKDISHKGRKASEMAEDFDQGEWDKVSLEEVKGAVFRSGYPENRFKFIAGKVENTIPSSAPEKIALLRLDTDWYESTKHELIHLYPRLVKGGVLIIDDYGHWQGARAAVDEYFADSTHKILLNRIDYTGRIGVKAK